MCYEYACRAGNNSKGIRHTHTHVCPTLCVCCQQLPRRGTGLKEQRRRQRLRAATRGVCEHKRVCGSAHAHTDTLVCECWTALSLSHQGRNRSHKDARVESGKKIVLFKASPVIAKNCLLGVTMEFPSFCILKTKKTFEGFTV